MIDCLPYDTSWPTFPAKMVVFDLDDTLAPSKSPLPEAIAERLEKLLAQAEVAIISGGSFEQFSKQVIAHLPARSSLLSRLHLMPTCGTRYYRWVDGTWTLIYAEDLAAGDRKRITDVLRDGVEKLSLTQPTTWGETIEDRGSQITFSALGQAAPLDAKMAWDPDGAKKSALRGT